MAVSNEFLRFVLDQLSGWGGVTAPRMFGGAGLYRDGKMVWLDCGGRCLSEGGRFQPGRFCRGGVVAVQSVSGQTQGNRHVLLRDSAGSAGGPRRAVPMGPAIAGHPGREVERPATAYAPVALNSAVSAKQTPEFVCKKTPLPVTNRTECRLSA